MKKIILAIVLFLFSFQIAQAQIVAKKQDWRAISLKFLTDNVEFGWFDSGLFMQGYYKPSQNPAYAHNLTITAQYPTGAKIEFLLKDTKLARAVLFYFLQEEYNTFIGEKDTEAYVAYAKLLGFYEQRPDLAAEAAKQCLYNDPFMFNVVNFDVPFLQASLNNILQKTKTKGNRATQQGQIQQYQTWQERQRSNQNTSSISIATIKSFLFWLVNIQKEKMWIDYLKLFKSKHASRGYFMTHLGGFPMLQTVLQLNYAYKFYAARKFRTIMKHTYLCYLGNKKECRKSIFLRLMGGYIKFSSVNEGVKYFLKQGYFIQK